MKRLIYEGRIETYDVEPGMGGEVLRLLDHLDSDGLPITLDHEFSEWQGGLTFGKALGPFRVTIEEIEEA